MRIETPDPRRYAAALLAGGTDTAAPRFGVVLNAAFDLEGDGAGPRRMKLVADPARAAVVMADVGVTTFTATDIVPEIKGHELSPTDFRILKARNKDEKDVPVLTVKGRNFALSGIVAADDPLLEQPIQDDVEPPETGQSRKIEFDLTYEADTALEKAKADIVVLGFGNGAGIVRVNGAAWLRRSASTEQQKEDADPDFRRNLFGFQPRADAPRKDQINDHAAFAAFHRRGLFFDASGVGNQLPSGGLVEIFRTPDLSGTPDYALRLPALDRQLRLRVWCGHGADTPPRWRKVHLGPVRPDTLILHPDAHRAEILWRCHWPADLEPPDRYRSIQIAEGGF